jgi:hypothetical protein
VTVIKLLLRIESIERLCFSSPYDSYGKLRKNYGKLQKNYENKIFIF